MISLNYLGFSCSTCKKVIWMPELVSELLQGGEYMQYLAHSRLLLIINSIPPALYSVKIEHISGVNESFLSGIWLLLLFFDFLT